LLAVSVSSAHGGERPQPLQSGISLLRASYSPQFTPPKAP